MPQFEEQFDDMIFDDLLNNPEQQKKFLELSHEISNRKPNLYERFLMWYYTFKYMPFSHKCLLVVEIVMWLMFFYLLYYWITH